MRRIYLAAALLLTGLAACRKEPRTQEPVVPPPTTEVPAPQPTGPATPTNPGDDSTNVTPDSTAADSGTAKS